MSHKVWFGVLGPNSKTDILALRPKADNFEAEFKDRYFSKADRLYQTSSFKYTSGNMGAMVIRKYINSLRQMKSAFQGNRHPYFQPYTIWHRAPSSIYIPAVRRQERTKLNSLLDEIEKFLYLQLSHSFNLFVKWLPDPLLLPPMAKSSAMLKKLTVRVRLCYG